MKRHTALIKRMRQSIGADYRDQVLKDVDQLSLEKYIDEIASAAVEGIARCKTEKDVWSAVEVRAFDQLSIDNALPMRNLLHRLSLRFIVGSRARSHLRTLAFFRLPLPLRLGLL